MSWSFGATGKPAAIIKKVQEEIDRYHCAEPEESIRIDTFNTMIFALEAMPDSSAVQVNASGSQSASTDGKFSNQLNVQITPIYNFVE